MYDIAKKEAIDKHLQSCKNLIKIIGYMFQRVGAYEDTLPYVYTVGRSDSDLPEFIVFGSTEFATVIKEVIENNTKPDTCITSADPLCVLPDEACVNARYILKKISREAFKEYAYAAFNPRLVSKQPVEIYQIFLSDKNNLLPGEPGYVHDEQPQLWTYEAQPLVP